MFEKCKGSDLHQERLDVVTRSEVLTHHQIVVTRTRAVARAAVSARPQSAYAR